MRLHLHNQAHHDRYQHSEKPGYTSDGWWMTTRILHQDDHGLENRSWCWCPGCVELRPGRPWLRCRRPRGPTGLPPPPSLLPPPYSPLYLPAGGCLTSAQLQFIIFFVQIFFVAISTLLYSVIWMVDQKASWFSNIPNGCFPLNQRFDSQCFGHWTIEWISEESGINGEDLQEDYDDIDHGLLDSLSLGI